MTAEPVTSRTSTDQTPPASTMLRRVAQTRGWALISWSRHPLALYVASRALVIIMIRLIVSLNGPLVVSRFDGPWPALPAGHLFLRAFAAWDGSWYLFIASNGYFGGRQPPSAHTQTAFFPVWPILIRWASDVTGFSPLVAGIGLVFVVGALASCAVWQLSREIGGDELADRATALWVFFPGSVVLTLVYSEGLTLLLASTCLVLLIRRQWVLAGLAAGVATGVAPVALVLTLCCGWEAGVAIWKERAWLAISAPVLSVAGIVGYFTFLWAKTGSPRYWLHTENSVWHSGRGGLYGNTVGLIQITLKNPQLPWLVSVLGLAYIVLGVVALIRSQAPPLMWMFAVGVTLAALASAAVGAVPRMMFVAFPYTIAIAQWCRPTAYKVAPGASGFLLSALTLVTLYQTTVAP